MNASVSAPPAPRRLPPILPSEPVWRLSVHQYHEMIRHGILTDADRVELIEGVLVPKMSKNPPHSVATYALREALRALVPPGWYVDSQEPLTLDDGEPEPDVVAVRGARRDYLDRHPGPADMGLVVEVADATLARDRGSKKRSYARERVPMYWIVNLVNDQIEVYTQPTGPADEPDYGSFLIYQRGEAIPVTLDGVAVGTIAVDAVLP